MTSYNAKLYAVEFKENCLKVFETEICIEEKVLQTLLVNFKTFHIVLQCQNEFLGHNLPSVVTH